MAVELFGSGKARWVTGWFGIHAGTVPYWQFPAGGQRPLQRDVQRIRRGGQPAEIDQEPEIVMLAGPRLPGSEAGGSRSNLSKPPSGIGRTMKREEDRDDFGSPGMDR